MRESMTGVVRSRWALALSSRGAANGGSMQARGEDPHGPCSGVPKRGRLDEVLCRLAVSDTRLTS